MQIPALKSRQTVLNYKTQKTIYFASEQPSINPPKETPRKNIQRQILANWLKGIFEAGWMRLALKRLKNRAWHYTQMTFSPAYKANNNRELVSATHELGHALAYLAYNDKLLKISVGKARYRSADIGGYVMRAPKPQLRQRLIKASRTENRDTFRKAVQQAYNANLLSLAAGYSIHKETYPHLFTDSLIRYAHRVNQHPLHLLNKQHDFIQLRKSIKRNNKISRWTQKTKLKGAFPEQQFDVVVKNADQAMRDILKHIPPEKLRAIAKELVSAKQVTGEEFQGLLDKHLGKHFDWKPIRNIAKRFSRNPMRYVRA